MRDDKKNGSGQGEKDMKRKQQEELLSKAFGDCMEEQLSFIPTEREIARTHKFSDEFLEKMDELCLTRTKLQKREMTRREFVFAFNRLAACVVAVLLVSGVCVGGYLLLGQGGTGGVSSDTTAEMTTESTIEESAAVEDDSAAVTEEETASGGTEEGMGDAGSGAEPETAYMGGRIALADRQELLSETEEIRTLVSSPVLDPEAESVILTIGNIGEEKLSYSIDIEIQVFLNGAWYVVPKLPDTEEITEEMDPETAAERADGIVELEAGMAQDEEILLSWYELDVEAEKYRAVVTVNGVQFGAEFRFEPLEEALDNSLEAEEPQAP